MNPKHQQPASELSTGSYLSALFYRWFIEYNPLYFTSALCFVFGVYLVSTGMRQINWLDGQLLLTAVIECYEFLLLAASFILYRIAGLRRPAVILAVINICFLFDCTYQTEHISANPDFGLIATALWIAAVAVKLRAMAWIFRLQVSTSGYAIAVLAAAGMAAAPHLLYANAVDKALIHWMAIWYGVFLAVMYFRLRPSVRCQGKFDSNGRNMLARLWTAAWLIWAGLYLFHTTSWIRFFDIEITLANIAPLFAVLPFVSRNESYTWTGLALVLLFSLASPPLFFLVATLCALAFVWRAAGGRRPRLYVGAIVCLHLALLTPGWQAFPLPAPSQSLVMFTLASLVVIGWIYRLFTAFFVAAFGGIAYWHPPTPRDVMEWGALFIAAGFASLVAGVAANWRFRFVAAAMEKLKAQGG